MDANLQAGGSSGTQLEEGVVRDRPLNSPSEREERLTTERTFSHPIPQAAPGHEEDYYIDRGRD